MLQKEEEQAQISLKVRLVGLPTNYQGKTRIMLLVPAESTTVRHALILAETAFGQQEGTRDIELKEFQTDDGFTLSSSSILRQVVKSGDVLHALVGKVVSKVAASIPFSSLTDLNEFLARLDHDVFSGEVLDKLVSVDGGRSILRCPALLGNLLVHTEIILSEPAPNIKRVVNTISLVLEPDHRSNSCTPSIDMLLAAPPDDECARSFELLSKLVNILLIYCVNCKPLPFESEDVFRLAIIFTRFPSFLTRIRSDSVTLTKLSTALAEKPDDYKGQCFQLLAGVIGQSLSISQSLSMVDDFYSLSMICPLARVLEICTNPKNEQWPPQCIDFVTACFKLVASGFRHVFKEYYSKQHRKQEALDFFNVCVNIIPHADSLAEYMVGTTEAGHINPRFAELLSALLAFLDPISHHASELHTHFQMEEVTFAMENLARTSLLSSIAQVIIDLPNNTPESIKEQLICARENTFIIIRQADQVTKYQDKCSSFKVTRLPITTMWGISMCHNRASTEMLLEEMLSDPLNSVDTALSGNSKDLLRALEIIEKLLTRVRSDLEKPDGLAGVRDQDESEGHQHILLLKYLTRIMASPCKQIRKALIKIGTITTVNMTLRMCYKRLEQIATAKKNHVETQRKSRNFLDQVKLSARCIVSLVELRDFSISQDLKESQHELKQLERYAPIVGLYLSQIEDVNNASRQLNIDSCWDAR